MTRPASGKHTAIVASLIGVLFACGCSPEPVRTPAERVQEAGETAAQLLMQVRKAASEGQYATGLHLADSLVHLAPELPESHYERGLLLLHLHQLAAADEALRTAVTLDPYHRGGWYQRGHVAFQQRRYQEAIRLYAHQRAVIESTPKSLKTFYRRTDETAIPQTWLQIGRAYELMQRADSAKWAYETVLAIDSTHAQANAWIAGLYDEEGRTEQALAHMRRAWQYNRGNPEFAYQFGTLLSKSGALEEALPLFEHVVSVQPWNAGAHYNLGRTLTALGRAEEGRPHLQVTDRLQDLDQAIEYARAAIAHYPDEPARWRELATLLERAGRSHEKQQTDQIIRALNQYVERDANPTAQ